MINVKFEWKRQTGIYQNGVDLFVGKWNVGAVVWDSCSSKELNKYKPTCKLPGVKANFDNFLTEDEGKAKLERVVNYWFDKIEIDKER